MQNQLQHWFQYVNFGTNQQNVMMQCDQFMKTFTQFQVSAERMSFPGEPQANYLVFKGTTSSGYPLKIILPSNYPQGAPKIYFDMQMSQQQLMVLPYINRKSFQIEAGSVKQWRGDNTLTQAITDTCTTLLMQPPSGAPPAQHQQPPQQQAWGNQQVAGQQQHDIYGQSTAHQQAPQDQVQVTATPQQLILEFDEMNTKYFQDVTCAVNALVDSKVAVHAHDKILDDQIDDYKERITVIDGNIEALQQENEQMQKVINESQGQTPIDGDNIDSHVFAQNPLSERLIKFHCKVAVLEDAMGVIKKAFDNDTINLEDYLKTIRQLANKQCKSIIKTNRLVKGSAEAAQAPQMSQMQPMQQPGMPQQMQQPGMMQMGPQGGQPQMMMMPPGGQPGMQGMAPMGMMQPGMQNMHQMPMGQAYPQQQRR